MPCRTSYLMPTSADVLYTCIGVRSILEMTYSSDSPPQKLGFCTRWQYLESMLHTTQTKPTARSVLQRRRARHFTLDPEGNTSPF